MMTTTTSRCLLLLQMLQCLLFLLRNVKALHATASVQSVSHNATTVTKSPSNDNHQHSPFIIVIDGGSTGSRLHIFEFVSNDDDMETVACRGTMRTTEALSDFAAHENENNDHDDATVSNASAALANHILPCLQYAASIISPQFHASTPVLYQATAGMRLYSVREQQMVYERMVQGLDASQQNPFRRFTISTLSGKLEGYYGLLAANYLEGSMNVHLEFVRQTKQHQRDAHHVYSSQRPIGALDMGGSSTQIVFLPMQQDDSAVGDDDEPPAAQFHANDFFATSYLGYGVDQFRERLFDTWIHEHEREIVAAVSQSSTFTIDNPCAFVNHRQVHRNYTLVGTGNANACVKQVRRLVSHADETDRFDLLGTHVGGIPHPPVRGNKFLAMSLYFFALDCLRELATNNLQAHAILNESWPNPSMQELADALDGLCSRSWTNDLELVQHDAHQYTRADILPHRCLESVYLVTLLKDGFGFDSSSREITFTYLVDGKEAEWSLGNALALRAEQRAMSEQWRKVAIGTSVNEHEIKTTTNETSITEEDATETESPFWSTSLIHTTAQRYFVGATTAI
ncbi:hypothetical protein MPSEU_000552200 [Mayamaea pseudoterrestris]|nr:hypothetical protein MPSEU_000552200 [Mayamaea pseudoterrestris]